MTKQVFRVFLKHVFYQSRYHSYNLWSIMILQSTPFILYKELLSMMITIIFMPWVHPFTSVIAEPTGSEKSVFVRRFVHNIRHMLTPKPDRILWCYGEYQTLYGTVDGVDFQQGFLDLDTHDPRDEHLIILDDLMDETDQRVASLFPKNSHHRNISVMYIVQNLFHQGKHHRTISLNAHYMVLFKNHRDVSQIMALAHQMYPRRTQFFLEAFARATAKNSRLHGDRYETKHAGYAEIENLHLSQ